ncbi:peptidase S10 serine carboxypeptidase [Thelephora terrestris]|uniref:Carboxypeptidase n=1 Tax=Thelephora terrestris TaxID=56493 RepID=A0A9P6H5B1_9AGAM|nr:peptidase S10 serine carboxypeptidase [Thelephora terrestris]
MHLSELESMDEFATLSHPKFPYHQVRIKKTGFCDPTVNAYTGYLDVDAGAKHLFFYFFESRRDPETDDVMMWVNGGPGCSSSMGLLMELGPCNIDMDNVSPNGTTWNPYSWNKETNIFFLDQPVGVGFSYADYGEVVETTEDAAKNVHAFITIFFETFPQFSGRPFHLAGESYAGRYLPVFAGEVVDKNVVAAAEGRPTINLKSVLIGNGITDYTTLYEGRYMTECGTAALDVPLQSISECVRIKAVLPRCHASIQRSCIDIFDPIGCQAALSFCDMQTGSAFWATGRNVYDISKPCKGELCYEETGVIADYLNRPEVKKLLGVETPANFSSCSDPVYDGFVQHMDRSRVQTQFYVGQLLERGVRILIYLGTYDWQCNASSNKLWVERLEWSGQKEYLANSWRNWTVEDKKAGETKSSGLLTVATVDGAGHMMSLIYVPHDKPIEALELMSRWLKNEKL